MIDLLQNYSITQIIIIIILVAFAAKEIIQFIQWVGNFINGSYEKKNKNTKIHKQLDEHLTKHDNDIKGLLEGQKNIHEQLDSLTSKLNLLINSDRDDIKAYITEKHHFFCYEQRWIDDYSLDCLEKRFSHYEEEGGNSFIRSLMEELRELPKEELHRE